MPSNPSWSRRREKKYQHLQQPHIAEDSLEVLVNELYKTRDPEFSLLAEAHALTKAFYTRKAEQIHQIIIEKLKRNTLSQES